MLMELIIALACATLFVGSFVLFSLWRNRRKHVGNKTSSGQWVFHADEWDFMVDGQVIAHLIPTGPPEDLNSQFILFDVTIVTGHEAEVAKLLYRSNYRDPEDERITYRSRSRPGVVLKDGQVYVGKAGENQVNMKAYPTDEQLVQLVEPLTDHPVLPHNPETPEPRVE